MDNIFNNTQIAFALKSDTELERAYFLFKLINSQPLVRIGTAVTNFAIKANLPVENLSRVPTRDVPHRARCCRSRGQSASRITRWARLLPACAARSSSSSRPTSGQCTAHSRPEVAAGLEGQCELIFRAASSL